MINPAEEKNNTQVEILNLLIHDLDLKTPVGLARAIGILPSNISPIMNGQMPIPKNMGKKLEDNLGVSRTWFDTGIGEIFTNNQKGVQVSDELKNISLKLRSVNRAISEAKESKEKQMMAEVEKSTPSILGLRLKLFLEELALSQVKVSADTKTPPSTINKYIKGSLVIPGKFVKKLSALYNLNYKWFYNGVGVKTNNKAEKKQLVTDVKTLRDDIDFLTAKLERAELIIEKLVTDLYAKNK